MVNEDLDKISKEIADLRQRIKKKVDPLELHAIRMVQNSIIQMAYRQEKDIEELQLKFEKMLYIDDIKKMKEAINSLKNIPNMQKQLIELKGHFHNCRECRLTENNWALIDIEELLRELGIKMMDIITCVKKDDKIEIGRVYKEISDCLKKLDTSPKSRSGILSITEKDHETFRKYFIDPKENKKSTCSRCNLEKGCIHSYEKDPIKNKDWFNGCHDFTPNASEKEERERLIKEIAEIMDKRSIRRLLDSKKETNITDIVLKRCPHCAELLSIDVNTLEFRGTDKYLAKLEGKMEKKGLKESEAFKILKEEVEQYTKPIFDIETMGEIIKKDSEHMGLNEKPILYEIKKDLLPNPDIIEGNGIYYGKISDFVEKLKNILTYGFILGGKHGMNVDVIHIKDLIEELGKYKKSIFDIETVNSKKEGKIISISEAKKSLTEYLNKRKAEIKKRNEEDYREIEMESETEKKEVCKDCLYKENFDDNTCGVCKPNSPQSNFKPKDSKTEKKD